jgi:hypothetical protein
VARRPHGFSTTHRIDFERPKPSSADLFFRGIVTMNKTMHFLAAATAAWIVSAGHAPANILTDPSFYGQDNTTFQEWNGFGSAAGPNLPTSYANPYGTPNWFDTTWATDGAFGIGSGPLYRVYSYSGTLNLQADIPAPTLSPGAKTTLVLQAEISGSTLKSDLFHLIYPGLTGDASPTQVIETDLGSSGSGHGGDSFSYRVVWDNLPAAATYSVSYSPGETSSSQISARVDTLTVVPEPASAGFLCAGAAAWLFGRRRKTRA